MLRKCCFMLCLTIFLVGCGHSQTYKVGLMSLGELEGKTIPDNTSDAVLVNGESCGHQQFLSNAVRDALLETDCDTLIDSEVTNTTGLFVWSNCIAVKGKALNSRTLTASGGK